MAAPLTRRTVLLTSGAAAAALAAGAVPATAGAATGAGADVVLAWNRTLLRIVRTPGAQPATVHPTRAFAILHAAIHDAVVSTTGAGRPYLFTVVSEPAAAPVAAAAQAGHDVLTALYPAHTAEFDAQVAAELATVPRPARAAGVRAGQHTARLLLALRAADGSAATPPVLAPGTEPGRYRPTPPAFAPAAFTHWPAVTPFVLRNAAQFRPAPYPALTGPRYAAALGEVRLLGQDTSTARTADQTVQARFWAAPIWNYWNEIAQAAAAHAGLVVAARTFARLNLAFADAVIAFYEAKYHYRIWRPITAVRLAGTDGNPATTGDPAWTPLATTPADPAYPGAHSVVAEAAATVLRQEFGPGHGLSVTSEAVPGTTRHFRTFAGAAEEAGLSRVAAGVHTRLDHEAGQRLGRHVARFVLAEAFRSRA